jgi:macrolide-specific efflux system membrane fusion protein
VSLKKKKTIWITLIIVFILALLAITSFWIIRRNGYVYVNPKRGNLVEAIYGLGKVKSFKKYDVKVGIMTKVKKVFVKEGEKVKKGDPLIQFTDTGVFKAPFDGTVTDVPYNEPDSILPQVTTLTMQDLNDKYLEVSLEQEGALRVSKGQKAIVLFESVRGEKFKGEVIALFPKNDEFLAHIQVEGLGKNVLPGMTADISIIVGEHKDALLVPISGVDNGHIIIRRDGKKTKIPIKIGGIDGEMAEVIESDLKMTDEILLKIDKSLNGAKESNVLLGR